MPRSLCGWGRPNTVASGYRWLASYGTTYYWRIDENGATSYPGEVWKFTTQDFAVVDDFESYHDDDKLVYETWIDGMSDGRSGSVVGYLPTAAQLAAGTGHFVETTIVHGGRQSMPLTYDNTQSFPYSEATRTFISPQDWTASGLKSLSLWFFGAAGNTGQLYVKINGTKVIYGGDKADLARFGWQVWNFDLVKAGNVGSVRTLTIGVEGAGTKGTLLIDDIRLYPKASELILPVQPATTNLVGYYPFDEGSGTVVGDYSGKNHPGTVHGSPQWGTGVINTAMTFNGTSDWVDLGNPADWPAGTAARSMCAWAKTSTLSAAWHWIAAYGSPNTSQAMFIGSNGATLYGGGYGDDVSANGFWTIGVWHHIALTYDGVTARLYADGVEVASAAKTWNLVRSQARIGQQVNALSEFWAGSIDDVRVYGQTLSPAEVAGLAGITAAKSKPF